MKKIITIPNAPKPIGPYSPALLVDNTLYVSGQIPMNVFEGKLVTGDIKDQTTCVMENLTMLLKEAGMDFSHVVKVSIFLQDLANFAVVNEIYASFLKDIFPARETIQVAGLPMNVGVEISLIAIKD